MVIAVFATVARADGTDLPPEFGPQWRGLEREIFQSFRPDAKLISARPGSDLVRQFALGLGREPETGQTRRGDRPEVPHDPESMERNRAEQVAASQARLEIPTNWRRVEIEVLVDAVGRLRESAVVVSSGRLQLDELAEATVSNAVKRRALVDGGVPHRVRFALEAATGTNLPRVTIPIEPVSGRAGKGIHVGVTGRMEERATVDVPFTRKVYTRVTLLRCEPDR